MDQHQNSDPIELFRRWLAEAHEREPDVPTAMTLATADADGIPSARMVLLKDAEVSGFVFYTNAESRKGLDLRANPRASLVFHWKSLRRQVRVDGTAKLVSDEEADEPLGAHANQQGGPFKKLGFQLILKQIGQFVLDLLDGFENLVLVPSPGNDHLAAAEDEADDFGIVESVDESRELLGLVLDLVERQVEG